ncbi:MAG TPA: TonB-dependent receptor [Oleiagrimonas sp.]|nr:TonB-dependent receptor [Oleiagrimonas sp.]
MMLSALLPACGVTCAGEAPKTHATDMTAAPARIARAVPLGGVAVHAGVLDVAPVKGVSTRIGRSQLARHTIVGSADILNYMPNLTLRKRYQGDPNAILGGRAAGTLQSARTLVYADGLLLSNFLDSGWGNAPRWGMVAAQDIASVDVLYGPYSALYPGNAMGTTVIFHTRMPERFEAAASAQVFVDNFDDAHGGSGDYWGNHFSASMGNRVGRFQWRVAVDQINSHHQPMKYIAARRGGDGASAVAVTGASVDLDPVGQARLLAGPGGIGQTRQQQASFRLGVDLPHATHALFTVGYWRNRSNDHVRSVLRDAAGGVVLAGPVMVDGDVWTVRPSDFAPSRTRENHRLLGLEVRGHVGHGWHWNATLSDYAILASRKARANMPKALADVDSGGRIGDKSGSGWRTLDVRLQGPVGNIQTWWLGLHVDRYTLHSRSYAATHWRGVADGPRRAGFDGRTQTSALYAQVEWDWSSQWVGTLGARIEHWRAFDGRRAGSGAWVDYPTSSRTALSPKAALAWHFAEGWQLRASLAKAVRFPTVGELFQGTLNADAAIIHNNPNLKPETDWARDLTLRRSLPNGYWRVSLFEDVIRDSLYKQTDVTVTPSVTSIQNVDKLRLRGVEVAFKLRNVLPHLDVSGSLAWNMSRILRDRRYPLAEGKRVPRMPRTRGALTADWRFAPGWDMSLAVRHSGRQYGRLDNRDTRATFGAITRYTMADAQLGWRFAAGWRATLGVNNFTNRQAWVYHPWPGRTWLAGIHWELP